MFDIGFTELLVLVNIALVVVGPEKLPTVMRTVGKAAGQARRFVTGIQNQIEQEVKLDELNKKIMAQDLEKKILSPHETEDAQTPSSPPEADASLSSVEKTEENDNAKS